MKIGLLLLLAAACTDSQMRPGSLEGQGHDAPAAGGTIHLTQVGDRFESPVYLTSPPNDSRLFIVEQAGRIRIVKNGAVVPNPFIDISDRVKSGGEQGLLSVAFHPDYARNGFFYVNYTDKQGDTHVERYKVTSNADVADPSSAALLLKVDQPYSNHNGGHVLFGPDGKLYVGMGDGGSGGDPNHNGQNKNSMLAKILRIDVDQEPYRAEVFALGVRNPWRIAFDNGMLYIADVGQNEYEEIDVEPASSAGLNYGWNIMEGNHCYGTGTCNKTGLTLPRVEYDHSGGACSVTGGFVYRGSRIPTVVGHYFYSDYCAGWLRSFKYSSGAASDQRTWKMENIGHVVSFGEDAAHDLYIISEGGRIYRFDSVS
jgi:glucose/arabinose dehydrogenase